MNTVIEHSSSRTRLAEAPARELVLRPGAARDCAYESHPVVIDEARIATTPVKLAYRTICSAIIHRDPGTCFLGKSRFGKTHTRHALGRMLPQAFPTTAFGSVTTKGHACFSERTLWAEWLRAFGHSIEGLNTADARQTACVNYVLEQAAATNGLTFVLMLDEAQNYREDEWHVIRDFSNSVADKGVRFLTVAFAHPLLMKVYTKLAAHDRTDLLGRFMNSLHDFHGLRFKEEVAELLRAYDDVSQSEFPSGSGISYSEFFLPSAFKSGWRLEREADAFFSAIEGDSKRFRIPGGVEIGMKWAGGAVRNFLFSSMEEDMPGFRGDLSDWQAALAPIR
jgi:hypothetical protein